MDSLKDLLIQKNLDEPSEVIALKDYYQSNFKLPAKVNLTQNSIILVVPNGKIATEIRSRTLEIQRRCQLTRKFYVKVSH